MWRFAFVPMFMVLYDYIKAPIDRLYFTNPHRPLLGIRNTFREIIHCFSEHDVKHYPGLLLVKLNYKKIREEFERVSPTLKKRYQHDEDVWSEKNDGYYYYKVKDFPLLNSLVNQIPCIYKDTAMFVVIEGPMVLPPHRAESNEFLRYQLTIRGDGDCTLYTERGKFVQHESEDFFFDHGRYHELIKTGEGKRVLLILDVHR